MMSESASKKKYMDLTTSKPDEVVFLLKLIRKAAERRGGMSVIAKEAGLSREALYRALSPNGNPTIKTLTLVLNAVGMELSISQTEK